MAKNVLGEEMDKSKENPPNNGICSVCSTVLERVVTGWKCEGCGNRP